MQQIYKRKPMAKCEGPDVFKKHVQFKMMKLRLSI